MEIESLGTGGPSENSPLGMTACRKKGSFISIASESVIGISRNWSDRNSSCRSEFARPAVTIARLEWRIVRKQVGEEEPGILERVDLNSVVFQNLDRRLAHSRSDGPQRDTSAGQVAERLNIGISPDDDVDHFRVKGRDDVHVGRGDELCLKDGQIRSRGVFAAKKTPVLAGTVGRHNRNGSSRLPFDRLRQFETNPVVETALSACCDTDLTWKPVSRQKPSDERNDDHDEEHADEQLSKCACTEQSRPPDLSSR